MPRIPTRSKVLIVTAVLASLLEIIDTSIVNVAVPTMMGNLGSTLDEISWVITGYIIANAIVLPIAGWLSEQIGRKAYYTGCIVLFTLASVLCGLAPNLPTLVIFRVIQGLAGGALLPTSQALIFEAFPADQAGMATAIFGMSVMIGPTLGPTLGGYLTDNFGWRSIFNINLPVGIVVAFLSWIFVEDVGVVPEAGRSRIARVEGPKVKRVRKPVDWFGLHFLVMGIGCLQYVLERGHADDWFDSKAILLCTILAAVSLFGLVWWELRTEHPILQLRHFANTTFRGGVFLMAGLGAMLYGLMFLVPIFVSTVQGLTATQTGMLFIPGALAAAAAMPFVGNMLKSGVDPRRMIAVGTIGLAIAVYMVASFDSQTSVAGMFWPLLFRGIAMSLLFVPINTTVLTQFQGAAIGEAAGMLNLCRQLGGSIAIAIVSTLFQENQDRVFVSLSTHITWFDPAAVSQYYGALGSMGAKMATHVGFGAASSSAIKLLTFRAKKEAFVIAFQTALRTVVICFVFTLIPLYMMKKPKTAGVIATEH